MENLKYIYNNLKQNRPLFLAVIVVVVGVVGLLAVSLFKAITNEDGAYNDPLSGETVYNPKDRTPETYGQSQQVTYLGFTGLINRGVSFDTVQSFKDQLSPIKIKGEKVTEISVDVDSIKHLIETDNDIYEFNIRFNRKYNYQTRLKVSKTDDSLTFDFSGNGIEDISFN